MKHIKLLVALLAICMLGAFAACGGDQHTHTFAEAWTTSETQHWHAATCGHDSEKGDLGNHVFGDGDTCSVCQYEREHVHRFAEAWTTSETQHWHAAICGHDSEKGDLGDHVFGDGNKCTVCQYEKQEEHVHRFAEEWTTTQDEHWHAAICEHETETSERGPHEFDGLSCTVCGYEREDSEAPVITVEGGEETLEGLTVQANGTLTLPKATALDEIDGEIDVEIDYNPAQGVDLVKQADGSWNFTAEAAGVYEICYWAEDEAGNAEELFANITVTPVLAETTLQAGENDIENLNTSGMTYKENFENGYASDLAMGLRFDSNDNVVVSIESNESSIAGNSLFFDFSKCADTTNTRYFFGSLDAYMRTGNWSIEMDVKIVSGTLPGNNFYLSFIYEGDTSGTNQQFTIEPGDVRHINWTSDRYLDSTLTWYFSCFTYNSNGNYPDLKIAIDNIEITYTQSALLDSLIPNREGTPKTIEASDLDGAGHTFTGADDNFTNLTGAIHYYNKAALVGSNIFSEEIAAQLTAENGFSSDYIIIAETQIVTFDSLNNLCTDTNYTYTITINAYAASSQGWYFFMVDGSGAQQGAQGVTFNGLGAQSYSFTGAAAYFRVGLYTGSNFNLFIGDITISRALREDTSKTPNGHEIGDSWTKNAGEINLGNKGSAVTCADVTLADQSKLNTYSGFEGNAVHFTMENDKTSECFQAGGTIENGYTYTIKFNLYIESLTGGPLMLNFDNAKFTTVIAAGTTGYQSVEITWVAEKDVDYFSFYVQGNVSADFYCSSITYTLTAFPG